MQIGIIGTCEQSCSLYVREQITNAFELLSKDPTIGFSFILLSTCRRVELYFSSEDLTTAHVEILQRLRKFINFPFEHLLFSLFESECFAHLIRVTSGLDSSITGESEIQKQVKIAYEKARSSKVLSKPLHYAFQKSLKAGKNLRSSFSLFKRQNSLSHVILSQLNLLSQKPFKDQSLLFIGNSQINRLMLPIFFSKNFKQITLCSQTKGGDLFKNQSNFEFSDYQILSKVNSFDAVICATKASKYLIGKDHEITRDQVFFDLSVPRNIDPKLKHKVPLLNIEEIGSLFEAKKESLKKEIGECESIVSNLVEKHQKIYQDKQRRKILYTSSAALSKII